MYYIVMVSYNIFLQIKDFLKKYKDFFYKKAYKYMKKYISYSNEEIKMEIYRYICIPGHAVSYYLGKKIHIKIKIFIYY